MSCPVRFLGSFNNVAKVCLVVLTGKGADNHWNPMGPGKYTGLLLTAQWHVGEKWAKQISGEGHPVPPAFFYHSLDPKSSKAPHTCTRLCSSKHPPVWPHPDSCFTAVEPFMDECPPQTPKCRFGYSYGLSGTQRCADYAKESQTWLHFPANLDELFRRFSLPLSTRV